MKKIANLDQLSEENQKVFHKLWTWFLENQITNKEPPQVTSGQASYHIDGLIGINESYSNKAFPLGAVMLEELLHYVASSDKPEASADFAPEFLHYILQLIVNELKLDSQKQDFQSMLIVHLWKLINTSY